MEDPPRKFFRLGPGREVRLRFAYLVTCEDFIKNEAGEVTEIICTYDPETAGGNAPDGRKVKGIIHWVSAVHALEAEVLLTSQLFKSENPSAGGDPIEDIDANSLEVIKEVKLEPELASALAGYPVQFERLGYFNRDPAQSQLAFIRTIGLRDSWAKAQTKG